jgi:PAS domain S-box-containing protein
MDRSISWLNDSLAAMFGYSVDEMQGMQVRAIYQSDEAFADAGIRISEDLECEGRSVMRTRLMRKDGRLIDCEIHVAPLKMANPQFGRMVTINDITKSVAINREMEQLSSLPHLELNPVVEVNREGRIAYFNDAAIETVIKIGDGTEIQHFLPSDIGEILAAMNTNEEIRTIYRTVVMGKSVFMEHITLSSRFGIARISAVSVSDARAVDGISTGFGKLTN